MSQNKNQQWLARRHIELWVGSKHLSARLIHQCWFRPDVADTAITVVIANGESLATACARLLAQLAPVRAVQVIVSDGYCRYLLLPRPTGARSRAELQAAIYARFQSSFGEQADDWIVRSESASLARHDAVCALRRDVVDSLHQAATAERKQLISIQPLWVWCAARAKPLRRSDEYWLMSIEGNIVTAGLFSAGRCIGLRSNRQSVAGENLGSILMREATLYSESDRAKQLLVFGAAPTQQGSDDGLPDGEHVAASLRVVHGKLPSAWLPETRKGATCV